MPATTARKGSAAYEAGIREGRAMSAKARRAPEESEEPENEEEEMDMDMGKKPHSRKRSAKNANNTKAPMDGGMYGKKPMDGECGCKGKKGGKCDGSCGGAMRKRGDAALTPHEYLDACDLGIQDRSRSYIRARLDLKCGKGAISKGEKCSKGAATATENAPISIRKGVKAGAQIGGGLGAAQGAIGGAMLGGPKGALAGAAIGALGGALQGAVIGGGVQVARKAGAAYGRSRERNREFQAGVAKLNPKFKKQYATAKAKGASRQELTQLSVKQAGEIDKLMNKRRDSPYASGFPLDSAALAI
jgi:outer membrane lipoprotein SlyB